MTDLPVNIDSTYADSGSDASVALHQQHHDTIHGKVNQLPSTVNTVASSGTTQTFTLPVTGEGVWDVTLTGNLTPTLAGATSGKLCVWTLLLRQDSTGNRTVAWPNAVAWIGQTPPALSTANTKYDLVQIATVDGGTTLFGLAQTGIQPYTVPAAVTSLAANPGDSWVILNWSQASNGGLTITNNKVYRGTSSGSETLLATISAATTYTDSTAVNGTAYYYKVSAVNGVGEGPLGSEVTGTPAALHYLSTPGSTGNYASLPSTAGDQITSSYELQVDVLLSDWTPASTIDLFAKWGSTSANSQWLLQLDSTGHLILNFYDNTGAFKSGTSTAALPITDGNRAAVRVTHNPGAGAINFYYDSSGNGLAAPTWTQLGTQVTQGTSMGSKTKAIEVGAHNTGAAGQTAGHWFEVKFLGSIGGSAVIDGKFLTQTPGATTFADSGSGAATWAVNGTAAIV